MPSFLRVPVGLSNRILRAFCTPPPYCVLFFLTASGADPTDEAGWRPRATRGEAERHCMKMGFFFLTSTLSACVRLSCGARKEPNFGLPACCRIYPPRFGCCFPNQ